jgi:two-component system OmpR family sensor kinase
MGITLVIILAGGVIAYYKVKNGIDQAEIARLKDVNDKIAAQIKLGTSPDKETQGRPVEITIINKTLPSNLIQISESKYFNTSLQHKECRLTVTSFYKINDNNYKISSYNYVTKANEILIGLLASFIWIFLLLLLLVIILGRLSSKYILSPFNHTLKIIQSFDLKQNTPILLPATRTKEFRELNCFLKKMTDKAIEDYLLLKEFTENASHELQTPLAIIEGKLELLMESDIQGNQAALISEIYNEVEKLSRINSSLILLAKLENNEYTAKQPVDISLLCQDSLEVFTELIEMKSITVEQDIQKNIYTELHPNLADILLRNLINNAIRHNLPNGCIKLTLSSSKLLIRNMGKPPLVPTEQLFQRFKKGNQCSNSIGIGLAIVKQICDLNQISISYTYSDQWHQIELDFRPVAPGPKSLQNNERHLQTEFNPLSS